METFLSQALENYISACHVEVRVLIKVIVLVKAWSEGAELTSAYAVLLDEIVFTVVA